MMLRIFVWSTLLLGLSVTVSTAQPPAAAATVEEAATVQAKPDQPPPPPPETQKPVGRPPLAIPPPEKPPETQKPVGHPPLAIPPPRNRFPASRRCAGVISTCKSKSPSATNWGRRRPTRKSSRCWWPMPPSVGFAPPPDRASGWSARGSTWTRGPPCSRGSHTVGADRRVHPVSRERPGDSTSDGAEREPQCHLAEWEARGRVAGRRPRCRPKDSGRSAGVDRQVTGLLSIPKLLHTALAGCPAGQRCNDSLPQSSSPLSRGWAGRTVLRRPRASFARDCRPSRSTSRCSPPIAGSGSATATLTGTQVTVTGTFADLKSAATMAKIHVAPKGIRGPADPRSHRHRRRRAAR